jgi:hypothetical protein
MSCCFGGTLCRLGKIPLPDCFRPGLGYLRIPSTFITLPVGTADLTAGMISALIQAVPEFLPVEIGVDG